MSATLTKKSTKEITENFREAHETHRRAKMMSKGVYEYRGRTVKRVVLPKNLRSQLRHNSDKYIKYGWIIEDLPNKAFRKKKYALDYIDGFVR